VNLSVAVKIPEVGESISEVAIGEWLKHEGDFVERDEDVVVIETDKATVEIPAPESGRVTKILKQTGDSASVNEVIAYIDSDAVNDAAKASTKSNNAVDQSEPEPGKTPKTKKDESASQRVDAPERAKPDGQDQNVQPPETSDQQSTGETKEISEEEKIPDSLQAPKYQTAHDATEKRPARPAANRDVKPQIAERAEEKLQPVRPKKDAQISPRAAEHREEIVPMSQLRRKIAERLVQAQQTAALLTTFNEIDMTSVIELRHKHRDAFAEKHQTKLGFMSFFVKAAVDALKLVPEVNAEIRGNNIVYRNFFDIGIAVGGGKGLVVPVLRDVEPLGFAEIEKAIADFARRAEQNKLKLDELQGGTFTISNGGIYGSLLSTPIVNPPQSAILGLHAIEERPVVRAGAVVIRSMMYVALTYDHRLIDGREAVTFLKHIKDLIEEPARMLLQI
jgi:2-oxoglutarate dehydrogenase E2 component (dihydrolipoamide succinyltransferase)